VRLQRGTAHQARELRAERLALQDLHLVAEDDAPCSTSLGDPLEPGAQSALQGGAVANNLQSAMASLVVGLILGGLIVWFLGLPGSNSGPKDNAAEVRGIG
jgi:hypothetical protein